MQWTEPSAPPGLSAYWVRVTADGWCDGVVESIFVTR